MSPKPPELDRRHFLAAGLPLVGGVLLADDDPLADPESPPAGRTRTLRISHFCDVHHQPEKQAVGGRSAALRHDH